jgi:BirA family transcriptional regulator, biotin operon repressor / biotin---[acetyl-CoA-carboxylase] ligase
MGCWRHSKMAMLEAGPYEDVARMLAGTAFATIEYVEETESTNADAAALLDDERAAGRTIVAEYQSRGAGRKGRLWLAPAGSALLFTTILPRAVATDALWVAPYWVALAVRAALLDFGVTTTLQWPNDLLLGTVKLAGVLCQSSVSGASARVACGVGINVRRPGVELGIDPPPAFCDDVAAVERGPLLHAILQRYDRALFMLDQPERVIAEWDEAAQLPGKHYRIQLDGESEPFDAVAQGLLPGGGLGVIRGNGMRETVSLADARVLR